jgi:hypothetical protein
MSDVTIMKRLPDVVVGASEARTRPRAQREADHVLALANPDRPEEGLKLVAAGRSASDAAVLRSGRRVGHGRPA